MSVRCAIFGRNKQGYLNNHKKNSMNGMSGTINQQLKVRSALTFLFLLFLSFTINSCVEDLPNTKDPSLALRFAVASDGHFGQADADYEADYDRLITSLNKEYEKSGLDFVVLNGDLFHNDPEYVYPLEKKLKKLEMPWYVVRGNHDRMDEAGWKETWGYGSNFSFEMGEYAFVIASTSNVSGEYICADDNWLWDELDKYQFKKGVFVFMHIPPRKWGEAGINCPKVLNCLESHSNVMAVFNGHEHNEDGMKVGNNIPYFFDAHFGGNWGTDYKGFRLVEVSKQGMMHTWEYNMEVSPVVNENIQHIAFLRRGKLDSLPSDKFNPGLTALTDGTFGSLNFEDGKWTGWEEDDLVWMLDLGSVSEINEISVGFLSNFSEGILLPEELNFYVSMDGTNFDNVFSAKPEELEGPSPVKRETFRADLKSKPCKYIKIVAKNRGVCPEWHKRAGEKAWLFVDEIIIN
jgi:hypothetical protein